MNKEGKSETITLKLSGHWLELWTRLKNSEPNFSSSEIFRQAVAVRASMSAVDSDGKRPEVLFRYKNEDGEVVTRDWMEHLGLSLNSEMSEWRSK